MSRKEQVGDWAERARTDMRRVAQAVFDYYIETGDIATKDDIRRICDDVPSGVVDAAAMGMVAGVDAKRGAMVPTMDFMREMYRAAKAGDVIERKAQ